MKKLDFPALIKESVGELRKRERSEKEARVRWRVQLLRLLKNREMDSIKAARSNLRHYVETRLRFVEKVSRARFGAVSAA
jgi:hypothetical protein